MMIRRNQRESRQPEEDGRSRSSSSKPVSPSYNFPKTRCYRLNLEKQFDISLTTSPHAISLGGSSMVDKSSPIYSNRDYSGPLSEADLPPVQGPSEYYPPPHLCRKDELRRHSWSGTNNSTCDLMANLQVSCSDDSTVNNATNSAHNSNNNETSIAISTARIFRGITIDRNGVITSQNARATRSRKVSGNEGSAKNKIGEKSRQAAKIDKAKDLIDEVVEGGGLGIAGSSNDENDPSKIISLYVMGEYDELNDLVRDGSKKLRESKSLSDEAILMYNRPRPVPPYITSPTSSSSNNNSSAGMHSPSNNAAVQDTVATNRKRFLGSRYKSVPRSTPPKLKSHSRDARPSSRSRKSAESNTASGGNNHHQHHQHNEPSTATGNKSSHTSSSSVAHSHQQQQQPHSHAPHRHAPQRNNFHSTPFQQCNFFPGPHSDWAEALGFSVNSLWNCGANNGHMSPTNHSASPRSHTSGVSGGGGYNGNANNDHGMGFGGVASHNVNNGGYGSGYHYGYEEGRNPSGQGGAGGRHYGDDGYAGRSTRSHHGGVRDTVVM